MYKLRDYQQKASDAGVKFFNDKKAKYNAIEVLPTGSGKSLILADIANRLNGNTIVFQPSKEILEQNYEKMCSYGVMDCSVYSASFHSKNINRITFATIGSVIRHTEDFKCFNNMIVDECFPYETFISTEVGKKRIGTLYNMYCKGSKLPRVQSYDESKGKVVSSEIVKVVCNGKKTVHDYEFGRHFNFTMTDNHPVLTTEGWKKAEELNRGDIVLCSSNDKDVTLRPGIDQMDLITGSVLGDGSLDKERKFASINRIRFRQGFKQRGYLYWKAKMLHRENEIICTEHAGYSNTTTYSFNSPSLIVKDELLTKEYAINHLNWKSLAILYMDDGYLTGLQNGGSICAVAESERLTSLLEKKLRSMGIDCVAASSKSSTTGKPYTYIRLRKAGLEVLCRNIAPYCHSDLTYKIIDNYKDLVGTYEWNKEYEPLGGYAFQKIGEKRICEVYNMEIANTHTYVVCSSSYDKTQKNYIPGMIVHNCHCVNAKGGMYEKFIRETGCKVLGVTATPYRLSTSRLGAMLKFITRTRPRIFSKVIYQVQISTLLDMGYLAPMNYYQMNPLGWNENNLRNNSTGTDYTDQSVVREYNRVDFYSYLVSIVRRLLRPKIGGKRNGILVFTRFVKEAKRLADAIPCCNMVSGDTPKLERERIINDFKSGKTKVVVNVGVLAIGFDYPELDTIVMARPTKSLALYYQICGRAIRPYKNKVSWFVDLCGNIKRFGKVSDLKLVEPKPNLWQVSSRGRQLTNVIFQ